MKKLELRALIREEIRRVLKEGNAKEIKAMVFGMYQSALKNNKVVELQKALEDDSIELFFLDHDLAKTNKNQFLKDAESQINRADWDAVSKGTLKSIQKRLKL